MQPGVTAAFGAKRRKRLVRMFTLTAGEAVAGQRARRIAVEPSDNAGREGTGLGFVLRQYVNHRHTHPIAE